MKKFLTFPKISLVSSILLLVLVLYPQHTHAAWGFFPSFTALLSAAAQPFFEGLKMFVSAMSQLVLSITSMFTGLAGIFLNQVVKITVVNMADGINNLGGVGGAINSAWTTVRDVANMGFIFILLYTSIRLILGVETTSNTRKIIVNIVVAALLINFSLFITKVVIDASNVVAVTFYEAIAPGAAAKDANILDTGISGSFTKYLQLQSLYDMSKDQVMTARSLISIGIMGSILLVIAAFIFLAVSILLIMRYVILIFVLILSPIAFISDVIPGVKGIFNKWKDALINQSFFPAVYFFMTWITLKVLAGLPNPQTSSSLSKALVGSVSLGPNGLPIQTYEPGFINSLINYVIVMVFLIATLTISKQMANKAAPGVDGIVKWGMGVAGASSFGLLGRVGRGTLGRYSQSVAEDKDLQKRALQGDIGARLKLAVAKKGGAASFDMRATPLGKQLGAGNAQKGGYAKDKKTKEDAKKDLAKSIKNTDYTPEAIEADRTQRITDDTDRELKATRAVAEKEAENAFPESQQLKEADEAVKVALERVNTATDSNRDIREIEFEKAKSRAETLRKNLNDEREEYIKDKIRDKQEAYNTAKKNSDEADKIHKALQRQRNEMVESAARTREQRIEYWTTGKKRWVPHVKRVAFFGQIKKEEEQAAAIIRKQNKEKSPKEKWADAAKEMAKAEVEEEKKQEGAGAPEEKEQKEESKPNEPNK